MYAILVGQLEVGQDYREIEYKEVARVEQFKDLHKPFTNVMCGPASNPDDMRIFKKMFEENIPGLLTTPEKNCTMFGYGAVKGANENSKDGYGPRVRIVEVD